jgi:hypothetical protein
MILTEEKMNNDRGKRINELFDYENYMEHYTNMNSFHFTSKF